MTRRLCTIPESLGDPAGAAEAVRFFVHGREVTDAAAASRVLAEARRLAPTLVSSKIDVRHSGDAAALFSEARSAVDGDVRVVRRVFLQTDVAVRLVAVTGRVDAAMGRVSIDETVPVAGPATERLSCGTGEDLADLERRRQAYVDEVGTIRRALLTALDPRRTRDAVRRLAKAGVTMAAIRAALGEPDDDVGSGIHRWVYALEEGAAIVGEAGSVQYVDLVSPIPGSPFPAPETTEAVYSAPQTAPAPR